MYSILTMMVQFDDTMYSINVPVCMMSMFVLITVYFQLVNSISGF